MPAYTFTGAYPRVLTGLRQGVNARHDGTPYGATIEPNPGDTVTTDAPFDHPELRLDDPNPAPVLTEPALAPGPVVQDPEVTITIPASEAHALGLDQAHTDMTAEGAPAPGTPQE